MTCGHDAEQGKDLHEYHQGDRVFYYRIHMFHLSFYVLPDFIFFRRIFFRTEQMPGFLIVWNTLLVIIYQTFKMITAVP